MGLRVEDHGTRDPRPGETSPAHFIAARDAVEPPTPDGVLEGPHRAHTDHMSDLEPGTWNYWVRLVSFMRAALPLRSRRKYSLARRTRADRMTSTFAIVGECSGKMRSTPWPKETLRTVNDARRPPRCMPITMPSKIWMRSLSPSRTFTCTRTVSPDFMSGRSVNCDFSTASIAFMTPSPS